MISLDKRHIQVAYVLLIGIDGYNQQGGVFRNKFYVLFIGNSALMNGVSSVGVFVINDSYIMDQ